MAIKLYLSKLSIIIASLIALYSAQPYFAWNTVAIKVLLLAAFLVIRFFFLKRRVLQANIFPLFICFILWLYLYVFHAPSIGDVFSTIFTRFLPLCFVILLSSAEKRCFLGYTTDLIAVISAISLLFFTLWFLGINLPSTRIEHPTDNFYSQFTNYYFFIIQDDLGIFTRFQSVFTEPGHLGMLSALLLYLNRFNFKKWQCWILLVSLIWSFSLAAYILLCAGYFIYKIASNSKPLLVTIKASVLTLLLAVCCIIFYHSFPDTILSSLIFSRFKIEEGRGIVGNNRNDASFMRYYDKFDETSDYLSGIGLEKYSNISFAGGNSSYRVFIVQYGLIGILLLLTFGVSAVKTNPSNLYWGLLLLYALSFWQRPYALWEIQSFSFLCYSGYRLNAKNNV